MKKLITSFLVTVFLSTGASASGLAGKFGLDFSYGAGQTSWGVMYHIIDLIAINPYLAYSSSKNETVTTNATTKTTTTVSNSSWTLGLDVPFYLTMFKALHFYAGPGIYYTPESQTNETQTLTLASNTTVTTTTETKKKKLGLGIFAGVQYPVTDQLHVFGRLSFDYSSKSTDGTDNKETSLSLNRTAVGAIFYFN